MVLIQRVLTTVVRGPYLKRMSTEASQDILFKESQGLGHITLNKPKALNAIDLPMVCEITEKLQKWENEMKMVLIEGNGRAFCAGGDVVAITKDFPKSIQSGKDFFRQEYTMNYLIGKYKIPYVALIDGITMGGGVGLSIHGRYRIATENTMFAMPETAIGLFPDVGVTHFLSRMSGGIGTYLALTGSRLGGQECVQHGIATHFLDSKDVPKLRDAFVNGAIKAESLEKDLLNYSKDVKTCEKPLSEGSELIDQIFILPTIEAIFEALEKEGSGWSLDTIKTLKKMSPMGLKLTMRTLQAAKTKSLKEVLKTDFRVATSTLCAKHSKDFYEGVRAMLIDKDKKPKWNPPTVKDVTNEMMDYYFMELPEELTLS